MCCRYWGEGCNQLCDSYMTCVVGTGERAVISYVSVVTERVVMLLPGNVFVLQGGVVLNVMKVNKLYF